MRRRTWWFEKVVLKRWDGSQTPREFDSCGPLFLWRYPWFSCSWFQTSQTLIPRPAPIRLITILLVEMSLLAMLGEDHMGYLIPRFGNGGFSEPITEKISDSEAHSRQRGLRCGIKRHAKASIQALLGFLLSPYFHSYQQKLIKMMYNPTAILCSAAFSSYFIHRPSSRTCTLFPHSIL
jgi:hypothetical protein